MLHHRNINLNDVAENLGVSRRWLDYVLSGNAGISETKTFEWLDRIEEYITEVTDSKGGIPSGCCSEATMSEYKDILQGSLYGEE